LWGCRGGMRRGGENNKLSYASYSRIVGDERGNQEHTCHTLQRAGQFSFSSRPKQYPFGGKGKPHSRGFLPYPDDRQPPAVRWDDNAVSGESEEVSSELWSDGKEISMVLVCHTSLRCARECGPEPLMDKEVG
jgi:hypothetical protein